MQRAVKRLDHLSCDPKTRQLAEDRERSLVAYHHTLAVTREEGEHTGKLKVMTRFLQSRFGGESGIAERLESIDPKTLDKISEELFQVSSLDEAIDLIRAHSSSH